MKQLLIHSCTYAAPASTDRDGNKTYGTAQTLTNVRLVPVLATAKSDGSKGVVAKIAIVR